MMNQPLEKASAVVLPSLCQKQTNGANRTKKEVSPTSLTTTYNYTDSQSVVKHLSQQRSVQPVPLVRLGVGREAPLGTEAKSASMASHCHGKNSNVPADSAVAATKPRRDPVAHDASVARRYALQRVAAAILPRERVARCHRFVIPGKPGIGIYYDATHDRSHYAGVETCASVWHCAVCAAKIMERRRLEVALGIETWAGRGGIVLLVTFTLSHHKGENLTLVHGRLAKAWKHMLGGRAAVAFKQAHGIVGSIRSQENTYGDAGWHPHLHVLMLLKAGAHVDQFTTEIKANWKKAVEITGGNATLAHGCDVAVTDEAIANYITKLNAWNASHELTKGNAKQGNRKGRSPLQLLADAGAGDAESQRLWLQYAMVMKGKRFLYWSPGLRKLLDMEGEKTDEEVANEHVATAVEVITMARPCWRFVYANDARAELLAVARGGFAAVLAFLVQLGVPDRYLPIEPIPKGAGLTPSDEA